MEKQKSQTTVRPGKVKNRKPKKLKRHQIRLLKILSFFVRLWTRTLRFHFGADVQAAIENLPSPAIVVAWHNRLFVVPEFYTRYAQGRKLAVIVSSSRAGAWLAQLFEQMDIEPIRGSKYRRGTQAIREMLMAIQSGYDVGITPDGSRGPMYEMKAGAAMLALRTEAPVLLLSYNFKYAWRLDTWDGFYIPFPFSQVRVEIDAVHNLGISADKDLQKAVDILKTRLDAITKDEDYSDLKII